MAIFFLNSNEVKNMDERSRNFLKRIDTVLKIKYKDPGFPTIQVNENGDWIDIKAAKDYDLKAGDFALIDLGVSMKLPNDFEALLAPRSSTFKKYGLIQTNSIGIIDNSYSGNNDIWMLPVYATRDTTISKGDRLCQFRLIERMDSIFRARTPVSIPFSAGSTDLYVIEVDKLDDPDRGGFGSTGK